jgi:hypothetical protein
MHRIHAKRGGLAWLLFLGVMTAGCEEWWGEEEEPLDDAGNPIVTTDAAVDSGLVDAGLPDAAPSVDASVIADAATDASPALDAAPVLDGALPDAAPDAAAPDAAADAAQDAAPEAAAPGTELPCDVAQILETRCESCHGNPPTPGPISLITLADLKATSTMGGFVYQRVQIRVDNNTMPPSWGTTGQLTSEEKATLSSWLAAGAPGSNNVCP